MRLIDDEPECLTAQHGVRPIRVVSRAAAKPVEVRAGLGTMMGAGALPSLVFRLERDLDRNREECAPVGTSALDRRRACEEQDGESRLKEADKEASWQQLTRSNDQKLMSAVIRAKARGFSGA